MTAFISVIASMVIGWVIYEYLTPWGTNRQLKDMEDGHRDQ